MRRKVSVTSTMFTNLTCKLSSVCVCVCVCFGRMLSTICLPCVLVKSLPNTTHCMGIYTQHQMVWSKDSTDGPKDHLSIIWHSKHQHELER
ncbi:hypothetical protein Hanom_Chr11g01059661 [Helianthus anomalus]